MVGCSSSPSAPTPTSTSPASASTSKASIQAVITTYRGAIVDSAPVVIDYPEALDVQATVAVNLPAESDMTTYICVMETATVIGMGSCIATENTVGFLQTQGNVTGSGISTFIKAGGITTTTNYVYVGIMEGVFPWQVTSTSPPRVGDAGVLATFEVARTVIFRQTTPAN